MKGLRLDAAARTQRLLQLLVLLFQGLLDRLAFVHPRLPCRGRDGARLPVLFVFRG